MVYLAARNAEGRFKASLDLLNINVAKIKFFPVVSRRNNTDYM